MNAPDLLDRYERTMLSLMQLTQLAERIDHQQTKERAAAA